MVSLKGTKPEVGYKGLIDYKSWGLFVWLGCMTEAYKGKSVLHWVISMLLGTVNYKEKKYESHSQNVWR